MTTGTFTTGARRSRPPFRWSASPIIDGEIAGGTRRTAARATRARRVFRLVAVLALAALLCALTLFAFPGA